MTEIKFSLTLGNSIIGVSILAMPYCFHQCGLVLGILLLVGSMYLTRITCHLLIKIAVQTRKPCFEMLAFHTLGITGKFAVEICIIGFLLGTCIAFFVVMGELGPAIVAKILSIANTENLRTTTLFILAYFICLPLGMIKTPDSLSNLSALSIGFYFILLLKIMSEALEHLQAFDWIEKVRFWDTSGILKCMPIFCMALACQTQIFEIYDSLTEPSLKKMNGIVKAAVTMCCSIYIFIGIFGYIASCDHDVPGNVLLALSPSPFTDTMKFCFVMSVAISFPLCMLPCRSSLYSCIFKKYYPISHEITHSYIPEPYYFGITLSIVTFSLLIALVLPSIEQVLGLVGSTIGTLISIIVPAFLFIKNTSKQTNEKLLAQVVCCIGIILCVVSTIANLTPHPKSPQSVPKQNLAMLEPLVYMKNVTNIDKQLDLGDAVKEADRLKVEVRNPARREPPNPIEPGDSIGLVKVSEVPVNIKNTKRTEKQMQKNTNAGVSDVPRKNDKKDAEVEKNVDDKKDAELKIMQKEQEGLIEKLEQQHVEQGKLIEESKKLLKKIKDNSRNERQRDSDKAEVVPALPTGIAKKDDSLKEDAVPLSVKLDGSVLPLGDKHHPQKTKADSNIKTKSAETSSNSLKEKHVPETLKIRKGDVSKIDTPRINVPSENVVPVQKNQSNKPLVIEANNIKPIQQLPSRSTINGPEANPKIEKHDEEFL